MKKTRKKKQVCGAACFMATEIKFSKDVRPSVRSPKYPLSTCTWVRWSIRPWPFFGLSVQLTVPQSNLLCWELLPDRNRKSVGLWYWELMSHPDPAVLPVGTLHSFEWFWVSRRIFIYSHHNTFVLFSKTSVHCPDRFRAFPGERMEGMAWNFACWYILSTFRTD